MLFRSYHVIGLENNTNHFEMLDSALIYFPKISYETEARGLISYIENHSRIDSLLNFHKNEVLESYLNQDISKFDSIVMNNSYLNLNLNLNLNSFHKKLHYFIIDQRNEKWIKEIPTIISEKPTFIAVGASHLAGKKGLINLLMELGYKVENIE